MRCAGGLRQRDSRLPPLRRAKARLQLRSECAGSLKRAEALLGRASEKRCDPDELYHADIGRRATPNTPSICWSRRYRSLWEASRSAANAYPRIAAQAGGSIPSALGLRTRFTLRLNNCAGHPEITGCMQLAEPAFHHAKPPESRRSGVLRNLDSPRR